MIPPEYDSIARRIDPGATATGLRRLVGGVSADVHALDLTTATGHRTVVVREHGGHEWKANDGGGVAMEYHLHAALFRAGLAVPEPLLLDVTGELRNGEFFVMDFVAGSTEVPVDNLEPCLDIMAATLAQLHSLSAAELNLPALPARVDPIPEVFDYLPEQPELEPLRDFLRDCDRSAYSGTQRLLHGDFWPGNLLWRDGALAAILDWEDAALGDPAVDVAGCRLEVLFQYGVEAMEYFTRRYESHLPVDRWRRSMWEIYVGYAGLNSMSEWGLPAEREADMRQKSGEFLARATQVLLADA